MRQGDHVAAKKGGLCWAVPHVAVTLPPQTIPECAATALHRPRHSTRQGAAGPWNDQGLRLVVAAGSMHFTPQMPLGLDRLGFASARGHRHRELRM